MANNDPSDASRVPSRGNPVTPHNGPYGTLPDFPLPPVEPQPLAVPPPTEQPQLASTPGNSVVEGTNDKRRLATGTELSNGRYKIEKLIAAGGMGAVYRALDTRFRRPCAVKEMLDEFRDTAEHMQAIEWFEREATLLLDLNHLCIPRVRDFFVESNRHYLVMDFIDGLTLGDMLEKEGNVMGLNGARGMPEERIRRWARQLCSVLDYLHRQNPPIIFRDLKPSNIMVTDSDEIKLIDFGIARTFQSQHQATIIMTVGYAPPEQLHGMPEPRSDLYALGATLHRVLTHHDAANNKPSIFSFPSIRMLRPDISPAFEQILAKSLAPAVEQRWLNAAEMERAILNLPPVTVTPPRGQISVPGKYQPNPQTPASTPGPHIPASAVSGPGGTFIQSALGHLNAGHVDAAYASIQQAFMAEPNNALVHRIFGQVFARRQPPSPSQAIQAYARSLQLNSQDAETHKLIGDVWFFLRRQPSQAIPAYAQTLRLHPQNVEAHQRLAKCYEETKQLEAALREYQEAARLLPKQPASHFAIGQLAMRLNQLPIAEQAFVQVLTINPGDHPTRFLLSQVYEKEGKLEDAWRECSYIVGLMTGNPTVQAMFQRLRSRLKR